MPHSHAAWSREQVPAEVQRLRAQEMRDERAAESFAYRGVQCRDDSHEGAIAVAHLNPLEDLVATLEAPPA